MLIETPKRKIVSVHFTMFLLFWAINAFSQTLPEGWENYLFFDGDRKEVTDSSFYISNLVTPSSEFHYFYRVLQKNNKHSKELACSFPFRYSKIIEENSKLRKINLNKCEELTKFLDTFKSEYLSIGLTSEYINAPSSAFGHLMLVMHNEIHPTVDSDVIHFSAEVKRSDGFFRYALKGLSGGYDGFFYKTPLFEKLNEYVQTEQRFVHFYRLNVKKSEILNLKYLLFELRKSKFDYYFLKKNCAYRIHQLLRLIIPDAPPINNLLYTIPSEVPYSFKPYIVSNSHIFPYEVSAKQKVLLLNKKELQRFKEIITGNSTLSTNDSKILRSTVFHYMQFNFRKNSVSVPQFRKNLLNGNTSDSLKYKVFHPLNRSKPQTISISTEIKNKGMIKGSSLKLGWRPVLQNLSSVTFSNGYESELEILHTSLAFNKDKKIHIDRLDIINVSLFTNYSIFFPKLSWSFYSGLNHNNHHNKNAYETKLGFGQSYIHSIGANYLISAGLEYFNGNSYAFLNPSIRAFTINFNDFKLLSEGSYKFNDSFSYMTVKSSLSYFLNPKYEVSFSHQWKRKIEQLFNLKMNISF